MTVRIGVVGCGAIARRGHLPGYRAGGDADVVAFASRSVASANAARDEWGSGAVVGSWAELVARPDVNAVDICTPPALHRAVAEAAIAAGKAVLVEKPVTASLADADALVAAVEGSAATCMVAHDLRLHPAAVTLARLVREGRVGVVERLHLALGHAGPAQWAPEATWFRDAEQSGGGALVDLGSHLADAAAWLGSSRVATVLGCVLSGRDDVDDQADVLLQLADGTAVTMQVSWRLASGRQAEVRVDGDIGSVVMGPTGIRLGVGDAWDDVPMDDVGSRASAAAQFAHAVATGTPVPIDVRAGRDAVAVVDAAYRAARTGAAVEVPA